jgi:hypothetical protein
MADNAPFSVNRPPYPNVHVNVPSRLEVYVAAITVAAGVPSVDSTRSSGGVTVADTNTGRITISFPPGGTGAVGWCLISPPELSTPSGQFSFAIDSDLDNYAAGTIEIDTFDEDDTSGIATAGDIAATFVVLIYVLKAAS